jgi:tetratricopeptide (TPR) repeat protein
MGTKRIVERSLRFLVGLTLTCTISILAVSRPAPAASQEREAHLQKAIDELHDGQALPAVVEASEAVEVNPRSAEALAILGLARLKCGEWEKAESRFNEAIAIDGELPEAHLGLGVIAYARMRYRDAIPHLRQATSSHIYPGTAYRALALSLEDLDLHQEASQAMREAGKYKDEIPADLLANVRGFADIFAAHDGRSLYRIPDDFESTSVDFRYSHGDITLPVVLNGTTSCDLIFDTGHGGSLMLGGKCADRLNLKYTGEITTTSMAGGLRLKAAVLDSVRIGELVMRDVPIFVCENYPFPSAGLIGWKLIQRINTTIDFEGRQLRFASQEGSESDAKRIAGEENAACVPFIYLTSMYIIARFGDDSPRAYVFDTGAKGFLLHKSDSRGPEDTRAESSRSVRIGDLSFETPQPEFVDFSAIHKAGRYYFHGVIGADILRHSVLHIFPSESTMCIEKGAS